MKALSIARGSELTHEIILSCRVSVFYILKFSAPDREASAASLGIWKIKKLLSSNMSLQAVVTWSASSHSYSAVTRFTVLLGSELTCWKAVPCHRYISWTDTTRGRWRVYKVPLSEWSRKIASKILIINKIFQLWKENKTVSILLNVA